MKTYISKTQILYANNEEEANVYISLKIIYDRMLTKNKDIVEVSINLKQLYHELSGNYNLNRYDKQKLEKGLQGLIDNKIIELIDTDGKDEYTINISKLKIDETTESTESYTIMSREEIRTIFNLSCKNKMNLLKFAVGLFGTINSYEKYGWTSFRNMPIVTNIPERTCKDYFKLLEDNNIIYVCHSKVSKRDKDGQIKNLSNIYGRLCDKELIDKYYVDKVNNEGHDFTKNIDSNKHGQITRSYNKFIKGTYDGDVIKLIQDCLAYNELPYQTQHKEAQYDLSVFKEELIAEAGKEMDKHWKQLKAEKKKKEKENKRNEIKLSDGEFNDDEFYNRAFGDEDNSKSFDDWTEDEITIVKKPRVKIDWKAKLLNSNSSSNSEKPSTTSRIENSIFDDDDDEF